VINKIDKPSRRIDEVVDEVSDLFLELAIDDSQLHYPVYYAIGREGKAWTELPDNQDEHTDLTPIFDAIINDIPAPTVEVDKPFQMLVTALQYDSFLGKYAIGRISRGNLKKSTQVVLIKRDGSIMNGKIDKIFGYRGLNREEIEEGNAGDIIAITGFADAHIGETIADKETPEALPVIDIEAPTLSMYLGPNTSPLKGKEAKYNTSRNNRDIVFGRTPPKEYCYCFSHYFDYTSSVIIYSCRSSRSASTPHHPPL
jgi:GTP-binding protein